MQIETELKKATLIHQAGTALVSLIIQPFPAISGTTILTIREEAEELKISNVVVNISELKEAVAML